MCILNSVSAQMIASSYWSFNPCFSGCASWISATYSQVPYYFFVSILVLVDVHLELKFLRFCPQIRKSFNPCFSGCASWMGRRTYYPCRTCFVSILVLVDVHLELSGIWRYFVPFVVSILVLVDVHLESRQLEYFSPVVECFNPCFSGCASWIQRS